MHRDSAVQEVRVRSVRVPMTEPHKTAGGIVAESPLILTDVVTDSGTIGHSLLFTYTPAALKPTAELIRNIEPLIKGEPLAPAEIEQKLTKKFRLLGTQGLVGMALAAIDMAMWDALARIHDLPLVRLLGGSVKPIRCYGPVGFDGEEGSARAAERAVSRGFRGVKAKIGYATVKEDVNVVRAMRKAVGPDVAIMVDYNQCLTPAEAIARLRVLDDEGLVWVEEPTLAHDYAGHARVSREARTPIQCGENWWGILDMRHAIEAGASDLVMPDVMKIGGVTGWLRAATLAQANNLQVSSHLWPEISARLLCCTPTAHWLEYADWWNPILAEPLRVVDGIAIVEDAPGSGVEWDEAAVQRFVV
ncbi:mandelate racemase [Fimbriiglobus ruber]|uniref:Mandelate racemase n=2 Tax=Fimbriiglobus ruber TaxID=1908690 RepID=A0A225DDQ0_9BACT|nr:enolase C-terminal domain-like protein [Fimbriiglobus ruber]OWK35466.1 mandelate racemase [Fimbriiglobus ruber]